MCGCGRRTGLARQNEAKRGYVKGQPMSFICGHQGRVRDEYREDTETGCWEWAKGRVRGYGEKWVSATMTMQKAHRVFYERLVRPVPAGMELDHICENKGCVNPAHLEPVTHSENLKRHFRNRRAER